MHEPRIRWRSCPGPGVLPSARAPPRRLAGEALLRPLLSLTFLRELGHSPSSGRKMSKVILILTAMVFLSAEQAQASPESFLGEWEEAGDEEPWVLPQGACEKHGGVTTNDLGTVSREGLTQFQPTEEHFRVSTYPLRSARDRIGHSVDVACPTRLFDLPVGPKRRVFWNLLVGPSLQSRAARLRARRASHRRSWARSGERC